MGNIIASLIAIVLVIISPVYFTLESAPLLLQWFGYVSPLRYAADAIAAALGRTRGCLAGACRVLAAYAAIVAMGLGPVAAYPGERRRRVPLTPPEREFLRTA